MSKKIAIWLGILLSIITVITTLLGLWIVYYQLLDNNEIDKLKFTIDFMDEFYSTPQPNIDNRTISQIHLIYDDDRIDKDNVNDLLGNYFIQLENCIGIKKCDQELFSLEYKINLIKVYSFFCRSKPLSSSGWRNKNGEKVADLMEKLNKELIDSKILRYAIYPNGLPKGCAI